MLGNRSPGTRSLRNRLTVVGAPALSGFAQLNRPVPQLPQAELTILHGKKVIGTYTPPSAPFSMTFTSTH